MHLGPAHIRVLLADDSNAMLTIVSEMLRACGFAGVFGVGDGHAALDALRAKPFELCIADYHMPRVDGLGVLKAVRSGRAGVADSLPVILLSGNTDRPFVHRARDAGATGLLAKPISALTLVRRLNAVMMDRREFIRCETYTGPDRRRRSSLEFKGPFQRADDVEALRQSLRHSGEHLV